MLRMVKQKFQMLGAQVLGSGGVLDVRRSATRCSATTQMSFCFTIPSVEAVFLSGLEHSPDVFGFRIVKARGGVDDVATILAHRIN